jgi:serine/threonine-protein kinase HipA
VTISDEFYSHQLSRQMGLASFRSELVNLSGIQYLAIERYDRSIHGSEVEVFHQEDAAQILGLDWSESASKFQDPTHPTRRDRPTAQNIAEMAGTLTVAGGAETWFKYLIYTVLIGNHDAHAKNVSIVHDGDESWLADLYDAVPILHINDELPRHEQITDQLALSIGGEFRHHSITRAHLQEEGESWGAMNARTVSILIDETLGAFAAALATVEQPATSTPTLKDRLGYNLDRLASGAAIATPRRPLPSWRGRRLPND